MLIYHPAFDAYHCVVRLCAIVDVMRTVEVDRLRLLDFCLCFPGIVSSFRLSKELNILRALSKEVANPYRDVIGSRKVFSDLWRIQQPSLACLQATALLTLTSDQVVARTQNELAEGLRQSCTKLRQAESFFFDQCLPKLTYVEMGGDGGLKDRSGLMEFRYDA